MENTVIKRGDFLRRYRLNFCISLIALSLLTAAAWTDLLLGEIHRTAFILRLLKAIVISCGGFYLPALYSILRKKHVQARQRAELRFLKRLFVLCGSMKPADFGRTMNTLITKSVHYRDALEKIMEACQKNNVDREHFFSELMAETCDVEARLFYEKLSIAANYDFSQAVSNVAGDFTQEKRAYARRVKKKTERMHILGITGLFVIMTVLLIYLLGPWLDSLNFQGF